MLLPLERGQRISRDEILRKLVEIQYERNDVEFGRGTFRVRGDVIDVYPSYEEQGLRIELFGDEVDSLTTFDPLTGSTIRRHDKTAVYPKSHFVAPRERTKQAVVSIKAELAERRTFLEKEGRLVEAQRLHQRKARLDGRGQLADQVREFGLAHGGARRGEAHPRGQRHLGARARIGCPACGGRGCGLVAVQAQRREAARQHHAHRRAAVGCHHRAA